MFFEIAEFVAQLDLVPGPIAQLAERAPDKGEVGSSNLPGPIFLKLGLIIFLMMTVND